MPEGSARGVIAIDVDDTLNDFSETLARTEFVRDRSSPLSDETFARYLEKVRTDAHDESDLLSTEYSYFRAKIHEECYRRARPRPDAVTFVHSLKEKGWTIVICTYRDLRRSGRSTREWLEQNDIPFDHLFMARNKIVFCRLWEIRYLIDDDTFNILYGGAHGVEVFYPKTRRHEALGPHKARGFVSLDEVRQWIGG